MMRTVTSGQNLSKTLKVICKGIATKKDLLP